MNPPDRPTEIQPITVEYASPQTDEPRYRSLLPAVVFCGAVPLFCGIWCFLLWVLFRNRRLAVSGAFIILFGLICFAIGCLLLLIHAVLNWTFLWRNEERSRYRKSFIFTGILLFSNFPACWLIIKLVQLMDPEILRWLLA